ncbi:uncharacterized protein Tco025E_00367 [Trypanosoma conorhini]|uniref:Uncharacterized protein n=1 Tax=Trypanosoma conorhini TaxID=83891 RepID=A0A3R7LM48_9TRYP|nr:uncharacterized protein Tco025E_00367 [Trypanosoma conorhini]RNF27369.1 hypothetical protein Tco025E_00367 [Trypanosoma conorhini]
MQDVVAAFPHAQAAFAEAKQRALARRRRRQTERCPQPRPWEFAMVGDAVWGAGARHGGPAMGPFSPPALFPALVPPARLETADRDHNVAGGMPFVAAVRVFASDWVTLTIQRRRKAPLCAVELPS